MSANKDKWNPTEDRYAKIQAKLYEIDSQNKTIIVMLNAIDKRIDILTLQLLQTLQGMIELKGEEYVPTSPSEQQIVDHLKNHGARIVKGT